MNMNMNNAKVTERRVREYLDYEMSCDKYEDTEEGDSARLYDGQQLLDLMDREPNSFDDWEALRYELCETIDALKHRVQLDD